MWVPLVVTGTWDPCFFRNPRTAALVVRASEATLPKEVQEATPVTELAAANYSFEALGEASENWREPVVVRGLFDVGNSAAVFDALRGFDVSVVQNSSLGKDHDFNCGNVPEGRVDSKMENFGAAFDEIVAGTSSKTIVVPPASRSDRRNDPALDAALVKAVDDIINLPALGGPWREKGTAYSTMTQLFIGRGATRGALSEDKAGLGTGYHADVCNNFFVQLAGEKNWTFMPPNASLHMKPTMRRGKTAIAGADLSVKTIETRIPRRTVVLRPGDLLYNPDWYWHRIINHPGFAAGVVARECRLVTRSLPANPVFTSLIAVNHVIAGLFHGDAYARKRLLAALGLGKSTMVHGTTPSAAAALSSVDVSSSSSAAA